jgi:hypothetical protein
MTDQGASGEAGPRVILFRPRTRAAPPQGRPKSGGEQASPVSDLAQFERGGEQDDYRHRMIVNAIALAFTVVLAGAGIWIAESMALMRKNQDCALMGRKNCSPINAPLSDRLSGTVSQQR